MIVIVGESASGKSTVEKILCKDYGYNKIVSYTTRKPRDNEVDGVDYHFVSEQKFGELNSNNFFAETATYNGWHYGTAKEDCNDNTVAVLTPHGLRQIKKIDSINVISFYIEVDRKSRLVKILERGDNIEEAYRRNLSDVGQFDGIKDEVDYVIKNPNYTFSAGYIADKINEIARKKVNKTTILCDIDETVNNLMTVIIDRFNKIYKFDYTIYDFKDYDVAKTIGDEWVKRFWGCCTNEMLVELSPKWGCTDVINKLMNKYDFYFVTSTSIENIAAKHKWLKGLFKNYDESRLIVCKDRSLLRADYIIDDCADNLKKANVEYKILLRRPWNENVRLEELHNYDQTVIRLDDWKKIGKYFEEAEAREWQ